jgi:hypothetical protein
MRRDRVRSQDGLKVRPHDLLDTVDLREFCQAKPDLFDLSSITKSVQRAWVNTQPKSFARAKHPPCSVNTSRALVSPASVGGMDKNYGYYKRYPRLLSKPTPPRGDRDDTCERTALPHGVKLAFPHGNSLPLVRPAGDARNRCYFVSRETATLRGRCHSNDV